MDYFDGKRLYITGGSSGIGLAAALLLASSGAHVAIFARNLEKMEAALNRIEAARVSRGQGFYSLSMDVSDHTDVSTKIKRAVGEFGIPDILIHCAGIADAGYFEDTSYEAFDNVIRTNLYGTRNVAASMLPYMKEKGGHIVIVSALAGLLGVFGWSSYSASKFAQVGFSECLRPDLARYNIAISVFCPGEVQTPLSDHLLGISPPESKALAKMSSKIMKALSPEKAAEILLEGVEKKKFLILAGNMSKISYFAYRNLPGLSRKILDMTVMRLGR